MRDVQHKLLQDHFAHLSLIKAEFSKFGQYHFPMSAMPHGTLEEAIADMDRSFWRRAFEHTGLMQILDAQSRKRLDDGIQRDPPAFTLHNVQATFLDLSQRADSMFADGVANVFKSLRHDKYKSNDSFAIAERVVMTWMIEPKWSRGLAIRHGMSEDQINDIDRVIKRLDGKDYNARELSCAMNNAFCAGAAYEDDYYQARAFKNGNLHLRFKRGDLLEKVNQIIANRYGCAVGSRK